MASAALLAVSSLAAFEASAVGKGLDASAYPYAYGLSDGNLLRDRLTGQSTDQSGLPAVNAELIRRVFERRNYEPIWTVTATAQADARLALAALRNAESEGLKAED